MKIEPYKRAADVLYKLITIYYDDKQTAHYPRFKIKERTDGYFHTLEDAERRISKLVEDDKYYTACDCSYEYYGFIIMEIPFDWQLSGDCSSQRTRTYLEDGTFFNETKVSTIGYPNYQGDFEPFKGRATEECRFKVGDLVEVLGCNKVSLEVIYSLPPTPAQYNERYKQDFEEISKRHPDRSEEERTIYAEHNWDYSDDSYITLDGDEGYMPNHSHPAVVDLFPVRRKVSKRLREMLTRGLEKVQRGE